LRQVERPLAAQPVAKQKKKTSREAAKSQSEGFVNSIRKDGDPLPGVLPIIGTKATTACIVPGRGWVAPTRDDVVFQHPIVGRPIARVNPGVTGTN